MNKKVPIFFYTLFLEGEEASDGQGKYEATIQVDILDANDNAPEFEEAVYKAAVQSTAQYGDAVILLQVIFLVYLFHLLFNSLKLPSLRTYM